MKKTYKNKIITQKNKVNKNIIKKSPVQSLQPHDIVHFRFDRGVVCKECKEGKEQNVVASMKNQVELD